ncbi:MAG TPA: hypothetical protein HPQ04_08375 [Rhodospirillaceae bacterium]|nr:hypothetical protein [Rhodospirillaceae bacterium]
MEAPLAAMQSSATALIRSIVSAIERRRRWLSTPTILKIQRPFTAPLVADADGGAADPAVGGSQLHAHRSGANGGSVAGVPLLSGAWRIAAILVSLGLTAGFIFGDFPETRRFYGIAAGMFVSSFQIPLKNRRNDRCHQRDLSVRQVVTLTLVISRQLRWR